MCGICGFYSLKNNSDVDRNIKVLHSMSNKLLHRGPDALGYFNKNNVYLGHTRLSIIDLDKRSNQPFVSEDGDKVLTYNGEIYNFREIKKILLNKGIKFKTDGDTEVLLKSYEYWGEKMLDQIDGMFAFTIVDFRKNILFSARDHFGQKPFFYTLQNDFFVFSSELTSLMSHPSIIKEIKIENIINYLHHDSFIGDQTPLKNVFKLEPSEYLIFNFDTKDLVKKKYWKINYGNKNINDDFSDNFFQLFSNSVKNHFISDVPVALYLSGGLDSTSIATVAKKNLNIGDFKAFNLKFNNSTFDEDDLAGKVAKELDINFETFELENKNINSSVLSLIDSLDEPIADTGYLAVGLISEFIKKKKL